MPIDNVYAQTLAGAVPSNAAFDLYAIDLSKVTIYYTLSPFVNMYQKTPGQKFPSTTIETGFAYVPVFSPEVNPSDQKTYKGVSIVRAINGS